MIAVRTRFSRKIDEEIRTLFDDERACANTTVVRASELAPLPDPVRRWIAASGVVDEPRANVVRLRQSGQLRTGPKARWFDTRAEQYFAVDAPAFVWKVRARMNGVFPIIGRDLYLRGRSEMVVKIGGALKVVDAHDDKIALGAMMRFLGEIIWFPSAALTPFIRWESVDHEHARAIMTHQGVTASLVFAIDDFGRVTSVSGMRFMGGGARAKLTPWTASCVSWRTIRGVSVPDRGNVTWTLPEGELEYYRWTIDDIETNRAELYATGETSWPWRRTLPRSA